MLTELRVRDLVVISDATLPLEPGLNVLTGETGAGKSVLLDALSLLLGERASGDLVRPGASKAVVEAAFDLRRSERVEFAADEAGVDIQDAMLVVRRDINAEGRNRAWANGSPTTVGVLSSLGRSLVDLHGQHEAQSLLLVSTQRDILDAFGGASEQRRRVKETYRTLAHLQEEEAGLNQRRDDVLRRADYLRHVVKEIEDTDPKPGEDEALAQEAQRLANVEDLTRLSEQLAEMLDGDSDTTAAGVLAMARKTLDQLTQIDASVAGWKELLESAVASVADLAREARDYASSIETDPGRLAEVEYRRDRIYRLLQKYGSTIEAVLQTGDDARRELDLLDTAQLDLDRIAERRAEAEEQLKREATALTAKREKAAKRLSAAVSELLPSLGMPAAEFRPEFESLETIRSHGREEVTFMVQLNKGIDARPVAQVASGGELSRIMLALRVVLAGHDVIPTLVFDEVDQGIGGATGTQVADALARVARQRQVLVITHLPQIAARAQHHIRITKQEDGSMATADVEVLAGEKRIAEIARMLGDPNDPVLRQHAQELLGLSVGRETEVGRG